MLLLIFEYLLLVAHVHWLLAVLLLLQEQLQFFSLLFVLLRLSLPYCFKFILLLLLVLSSLGFSF